MNFKSYIQEHGIDACAAMWGFTPRRVRSWLYDERGVKPEDAKKIVRAIGDPSVTGDSLHFVYGDPWTDAA